jgi:hypothetical protein
VAILAALPLAANAGCGFGVQPDYGDIQSIALTHTGCGGWTPPEPSHTMDCSKYWATFSQDNDSEYSQYNMEGQVGYFILSVSFENARSVLVADRFLELNPVEQRAPTDTKLSTISVTYCSTVRSVKIYTSPPAKPAADAPALKIFADLALLISDSKKRQVDPAPRILNDVFNPWY